MRWMEWSSADAETALWNFGDFGRFIRMRTKANTFGMYPITVGGDRLEFDSVTTTQCAGLVTTKILFNSTVSTPGARFFTFDINDFYYGSPMKYYEYMRIQL